MPTIIARQYGFNNKVSRSYPSKYGSRAGPTRISRFDAVFSNKSVAWRP